MMTKRITILILMMHIGQNVSAQYAWHTTYDSKSDSVLSAVPILLGCHGNHCTSVVNVATKGVNFYTFFRSDDGGRSWRPQFRYIDNGKPTPIFSYFVAIQQIDSENAIVVGDSGHIFRTFDAGNTWIRQESPAPYQIASLWGVHFHDPLNGIIGAPNRPLTTSDGGNHWQLGPIVGGLGDQNCHCYGNDQFGILCQDSRRVYHTKDNWQTFDSSEAFADSSLRGPNLRYVNWNDGDTIISYGFSLPKDGGTGTIGLIVRTLDGGAHWKRSTLPAGYGIITMSSLNANPIFAGRGDFARNTILQSTDLGLSWTTDTVHTISLGSTYEFDAVPAVEVPSSGNVLAMFSIFPGASGIIARGQLQQQSVITTRENEQFSCYPNPATTTIHIEFDARNLFDALGRSCTVSYRDGMLDISSLPAGVYYLSDGKQRARFVKQ